MPVRPEDFRRALRCWASGVTVVTARAGDRIHGMTVSAFASVCANPPLVLVCADKSSDTHALIAEGGVFTANILAQDQQALAQRFAVEEEEERRFEGLACGAGATGAPRIPGAVASLDCRVVAAHEAGDHVVYVGRVEAVAVTERAPLLYHAGTYRSLATPRERGAGEPF